MKYEYKVIPAPARAEGKRGQRRGEDRFSQTLGDVMNVQARQGWEYQRAETLPCEERHGLRGRSTVTYTVLVFRRPHIGNDPASPAPKPVFASRSLNGPEDIT
ncbi:uncharacterized protein DUF4177 [Rhodovulum imhoffii]|uniref:Uncharacterized protein DUF4177 n=1 Tax=Rhodovulum imhoffii TaxID=365340 RepID=A0A2T5BQS9_9RHOB|nr:DUF4177 domain-containing protein [Rhodovulum imhoffii]MBK5933861.1 hypothetical protein [Rhodovulum imhoffii]PTN01551.1 uncharacterized protein DUF4177 [Rhodovulum imhoffii]